MLAHHSLTVHEMHVTAPTLEDAFLRLTGKRLGMEGSAS
jgi:hypothetical protein